MAAEEHGLAERADPDGRSVVLLARIWHDKITRDHPELREHLGDVLAAVQDPTRSPTRTSNGAATTAGAWVRVGGCWWS